jgi:hypothetical protein
MQIGVKCIRGNILHNDCRSCALNPLHPCQYGPDVLEKMRVDYTNPDREPDQTAFTPSRLLSCPRQAQLQSRTDYYIDVDNAYPMTRGNMVHALMEKSRYPGVPNTIREHRFQTTIDTDFGTVTFTGKSDLVTINSFDPVETTWHVGIVDYKTISKIGHDMVRATDEHIAQINMYAWLVTKALPGYHGFDKGSVVVDTLEIEYFAMEKSRRFTSAGPLLARGKRITGTHPWEYETIGLLPIPFYPLEKTELAIRRRIETRLRPELAPILPEEERWKCPGCPVYELCYGLPEQGGIPIESIRQDESEAA